MYVSICLFRDCWCFVEMIAGGATRMEVTIDEVGPMGAGDVAYERAHFKLFDATGKITYDGK